MILITHSRGRVARTGTLAARLVAPLSGAPAARAVFPSNPNSPSGADHERGDIERLMVEQAERLLVLDEASAGLVEHSRPGAPLLDHLPKLAI